MADIRNDQYLHRPGAGRGAITPADPLEVLLYDGSGNPLLVKRPTGETRQALGVAGYGYDGTNWRPVKVNASGQAEVQLTGSDVQIEVTQLLNAEPLSAGENISREFDLQTYGELVFWVAIDRQYSLRFYQQFTSGGTNLPIAVAIADDVSPPALGRTHAYNITQYLPAHTGRLLVSNRDATQAATVSLWIGRVKRL